MPAKPRLIPSAPEPVRQVPTTPAYERGWRLGAIRVRRDLAEQIRRQACDADLSGDEGAAFRLHAEADRHDLAADRLMREIDQMSGWRS